MIVNANALHIPLADGCVHTIVTSPPYYGLRDYGTAKWEGGDPNCEHKGEPMRTKAYINGNTGTGNDVKNAGSFQPYKNVCGKCGAIRIDAQIGLEVTPDAYIANLVDVFRECRRVLRDDGTLWVNIGDSYNGSGGAGGDYAKGGLKEGQPKYPGRNIQSVKPKDLIGIPWMLAFALRADGWYLRQDIIWHKPNPMPESVKDRCTKSHEYIFLLSKSARYYYDNEAVKEPAKNDSGWAKQAEKGKRHQDHKAGSIYLANREESQYGLLTAKITPDRNKRDVWTVTTKPYKGAHYATYPPDLITPCILAGAPETCCAKCGAPYERVVERDRKARNELPKDDPRYRPNTYHGSYENINGKGDAGYTFTQTLGFQPTCTCNAGTSSGIVFDPFVGSGTTVATAIKLGRKGIGIDLNIKYLTENARQRIADAQMQPRLPL
jgi:DNA modification methylase